MDEPENITLDDEGKPSKHDRVLSRALCLLEITTPQDQVEVLNIYGNTDKGNDERVTNLSSQSLGYLLKGHVKSYQEKEITGLMANTVNFMETALVDEPMIAFLWGK